MWSRQASYFRLLILSFLCFYGAPARAIVVDNLYQAKVPVSGQGEEVRKQALAQAFKSVVLRVSGLRTAMEHPVVEEASKNAQQYVAQFAYVDAGGGSAAKMLQASFVPGWVDKVLADAALPNWGNNRPAIVTWLAIEQNGRRELLGSEGAASLMAQLERRAAERGLPLVIPLMDLEDSGKLSASDVWSLAAEPVNSASARYSHDAVLTGRVSRIGEGQWQAHWQLQMPAETLSDSVTAASSDEVLRAVIDSVAERLASRYGVQGALASGTSSIELEVSGVNSLKDYATLGRYLNSLAPVRSAQPAVVEADRIRYRLELKGPVTQVQEYLALEKRLRPEIGTVPSEAMATNDRATQVDGAVLNYRWQP